MAGAGQGAGQGDVDRVSGSVPAHHGGGVAAKGLYHWGQVCGIGAPPDHDIRNATLAWQSATVFFAVIDLVAAVGLWLAAAWGAVVWLTSVVSMAVVEVFFPGVYGGSIFIVLTEMGLLCVYLWLAILSARERPVTGQD